MRPHTATTRGSSGRGAPFACACATGALAALRLALAVTVACAVPAAGVRGPGRAAPAAATPHGTCRFGALAWDASPAAAARALAAAGFVRAPGGAWSGRAYGRRVRLETETGAQWRLEAVTLRFAEAPRGEALARYDALVAELARTLGPWAERIPVGRPVTQERIGRGGVVRRYGERTAATLWTDEAGGAAAAQLDGDGVLWLRYESPRRGAAPRR